MLTLINANRMQPLIAPIGLDYVAGACRQAGIKTEVLDLALAEDPQAALTAHFAHRRDRLVGVTFRNVDDSFWPSAQSFLGELEALVWRLRGLTEAPIVLGGVGFSILAGPILQRIGADFGVRGDGEAALPMLAAELAGRRRFDRVPGLVWRRGQEVRANPPAWPADLTLPTQRDAIDNARYFHLGGQGGVETKRGCPGKCIYCADPLAKGPVVRPRPPAQAVDEVKALLGQGVDVLHLCDGEFNIPLDHAKAVCRELIGRGLGGRVRWYAYLAVTPFDAELAAMMARAGCVGINFTTDSADERMIAAYGHPHRRDDLARAVALSKAAGITVMLDLLIGGPGETPESVRQSIQYLRGLEADAIGAALGLRVYPGTPAAARIAAEGPMEHNPAIRRRYDGPVDLVQPTFYVSAALPDRPARFVNELIGDDPRFFKPLDVAGDGTASDHNYNDNAALVAAIAAGRRGAYWDILRRMR